ncbi:MAG: hypothetical protein QW589_02275 [Candidatus Bathyarchaeia archaeon]
MLKVFVVDTSAFIAGFDPFSVEEKVYTVPEVWKELVENTIPYFRFETSYNCGRLKVKSPSLKTKKTVIKKAIEIGEKLALSEADLKILALGLDLKLKGEEPIIISDDYSIQNMAESLGLKYSSLITFGISYRFKWIFYCPACFKKYPQSNGLNVCIVCGTTLKRKVLKKKSLKK